MIVYMITNKINGKRYVGQSKHTAEHRFKKHKEDALIAKRGYALHSAIRKYGIENFEIKVLARCNSLEEMNHRESLCVKLFCTLSPNGYNLTGGGGSKVVSEETKKKQSESRKGERHHFFGKHFSDEHKANLSKTHLGRVRGPLSQEHKDKISKSNSGKSPSQSHRDKLSKALEGTPLTSERKENIRIAFWKSDSAQSRIDTLIKEGMKTAKPIFCHQTNKIYRSVHQAAKELGVHRPNIATALKNNGHASGFTFSYVDKDKDKLSNV